MGSGLRTTGRLVARIGIRTRPWQPIEIEYGCDFIRVVQLAISIRTKGQGERTRCCDMRHCSSGHQSLGGSMFAGSIWYDRDGSRTVDPGQQAVALLQTLMPLHEPDVTGVLHDRGVVLAQALNWNTAESLREDVPTICPHTGNVLVSWIRLDNRGELAAALRTSPAEATRMTDPELVLAAYRRWRYDTARHLQGDFAIAVVEPDARCVYLARDPIGIRPLYYARTSQSFSFATVPASFRAVSGVDTALSEKWLAFYLAGHAGTVPGLAPMGGIDELLPATQAVIQDGAIQVSRYHEFVDDAPWADEPDAQQVELYRREFVRSVGMRMRSAYPLGSENSGGLDSASIIAVMRDLADPDISVETFGMPAFVSDADRMRLVVQGSSFGFHSYPQMTDYRLPAALRAARILGHAPEYPGSYWWSPFASAAQELNVRTMMSGHGGDHAVTYEGQLLYREMAMKRKWGMLSRQFTGNSLRSRARALRFMATQHRRDIRDAKILQTGQQLVAGVEALPLTRRAVHELGVLDHVAELGQFWAPFDSLNTYIIERSLNPYMTRRAAESCQVSHAVKVEYRYPMLDPILIQRYLSSPAIEKCEKESTRFLHRRALRGLMHDDLVGVKKSGLGPYVEIPTWRPPQEQPPVVDGTCLDGLVDSLALADAWNSTSEEEDDLRLRILVVLDSSNLSQEGSLK